jgi:hypothetical protein
LRVAHCCFEHADQSFGSLNRAPGQPEPGEVLW